MMPVELRTARLLLRQLRPTDLEAVHDLFSSPGHTIGDGPITDRAKTAEWLQRRELRYADLGLVFYGAWTEVGEMVGYCGAFAGDRSEGLPELGYEVGLEHRGRGYATEAAGAVLEAIHAAGHPEVWATIRPWNLASARVVEGLGFALVRTDPDAKGPLDYYRHTADPEQR